MMLLASAGGNRVPVSAQLVQADEDTVRDVIHRFNEIGMAALDPRWAGGRRQQRVQTVPGLFAMIRSLRTPSGRRSPSSPMSAKPWRS